MSNNSGGFPNVGVNFVAQNAEQYLRTIAQAQAGLDEYRKRIDELVRLLNQSEAPEKKQRELIAQLEKQYLAAKDALVIYQNQLKAGVSAAPNFIDKTQTNLETLIQDTNVYAQAQTKAGQGNDKLGAHFTSLSSAIGASRVGVGLFTRELVQLAGGGTVATQALDSFVYSTGTLGVVLGVVTIGLGAIRHAVDSTNESFKAQEQLIAATSDSYEELYNARLKALTTGQGLPTFVGDVIGSAGQAGIDAYGKQLGNTYGRAFQEGFKGNIAGFFNALTGNLNIGQAWFNIGRDAAQAFQEGFKQRQQQAATELFVDAAKSRAGADALRDQIDQLQLAGASYDELVPKAYDYLNALKQIGRAQGSGVGGAITGTDIEAFLGTYDPYAALSKKATDSAKKLLDIQQQYNDDSAALSSDHGDRILEIETRGWEQQVKLAREYEQRKQQIQDQFNQDSTDAYNDYRARVADAEANAGERRNQIAQDYADKRAQIETDYQDKVAKIQSDYANSLFDIVAKDDAKGLVRARLTRDKQLADAAKQRDKENADADKQKAKQQKDLDDALAKQKKQLEEDYKRRERDLQQAYDKQNAQNNQNYKDSLADLVASVTSQEDAENASYTKRQKALEDAKKKRIDALTDELFTTKDLYEKYGQAIIDSLSKILDPATIVDLVNGLQKALDTKIEIKITPNALNPGGPGGVSVNPNAGPIAHPSPYGTPHQYGGYIAQNEYAYLHAGETVLPRNPMRAYELAAQHMARVQMPMTRTASAWGGGKVTLYIDNSVNSKLLDSQIRVASIGVVTEVVRRALT